MSGILKFIVPAIFLGILLTSYSRAQELSNREEAGGGHDESWYREQPTYKPDTRAIIQQKSQIRADQRQARLASLSWYGVSNSRPTGAPTPFTSRYSPVWEMPGGRPFAWYPYARPGYVMYWR